MPKVWVSKPQGYRYGGPTHMLGPPWASYTLSRVWVSKLGLPGASYTLPRVWVSKPRGYRYGDPTHMLGLPADKKTRTKD